MIINHTRSISVCQVKALTEVTTRNNLRAPDFYRYWEPDELAECKAAHEAVVLAAGIAIDWQAGFAGLKRREREEAALPVPILMGAAEITAHENAYIRRNARRAGALLCNRRFARSAPGIVRRIKDALFLAPLRALSIARAHAQWGSRRAPRTARRAAAVTVSSGKDSDSDGPPDQPPLSRLLSPLLNPQPNPFRLIRVFRLSRGRRRPLMSRIRSHTHATTVEAEPHNALPLPFHNEKRLRSILEGTGINLIMLPTYSSDFNPIEKKWANLKRALPDILPNHNTLQNAILEYLYG